MFSYCDKTGKSLRTNFLEKPPTRIVMGLILVQRKISFLVLKESLSITWKIWTNGVIYNFSLPNKELEIHLKINFIPIEIKSVLKYRL